MSAEESKQSGFRSFPYLFWLVVLFEFFERGAYYGLTSILSVYMTDSIEKGGLGFTKGSVGIINSTIRPLLYLLPILSGAIADRFGYRRCLLLAFSLLGTGYFLAGRTSSYGPIFGALLVMAVGAGTFKPIISGTIARVTNEKNSGLGFGVFYWSINLGAFLFPLVLVAYLKKISYSWVFTASAIATGAMLLPTLFAFRDPPRPDSSKSLAQVLTGALTVLKDFRFILMIVIYSGFWIMYFQMFDTVLWYLRDYVSMAPVDAFVNSALSTVGLKPSFKFDVEHVTVINAGTIIALQLVVAFLVKKARPLPTMILGICLGVLGFVLLAISENPLVFIAGIIIFSLGEMTAHPKYISYVGQIAPEDKKATYMGYAFLYGVIGSSIGGILGAKLYSHFVDALHRPRTLWLIFASIGVATVLGLLGFDRFVARPAKTV